MENLAITRQFFCFTWLYYPDVLGHFSTTWVLTLKWLEIWKEEQKRTVRLSDFFEIRFLWNFYICLKINDFGDFLKKFQNNSKILTKFFFQKIGTTGFCIFTPLSDSVTILKITTLVKEQWHKTYQLKKWGENT